MAISKNMNYHWAQGMCVTSGDIATMWMTNFNMPVPDLDNGSYDYANGYVAARYGADAGTYNMSAFYPGYEFIIADTMYRYCVTDGSSLNGSGCFVIKFICGGSDMSGSATCSTASININAPNPGWEWQFYWWLRNTGVAGWEVDSDNTYGVCSFVSAISGDDISIGGVTRTACVCNVPAVGQCSGTYRGNMWVEGDDLHFINANCFEHVMCGIGCSIGGPIPGSIWIDNNHYLNWAGCSGTAVFRACWRICQFCSWFTNGSGPNPSPGAGYAGAIWADTEFGYTHLAYIGCDGNKYITGAGHCNLIAPY